MISTPWGPLGYITYKRTYARPISQGKTEEYTQSVDRIIKACKEQLKCGFTPEEEADISSYLLNLKCSVAGRFLWQLGTTTVDRLGLLSLQNCAAVVVDHPIHPFLWAMDALMLGSGVGYNIQREYVYELPKIKQGPVKRAKRLDTKDADFIVPDSREGWVELLHKTLSAYYITGKSFTYSTVCIRGKGTPIKSFGGTASGPEELCQGIEWICQVLDKRRGKKVRPIDCLDVMNILGFIVVAGNVRRSAQIAIGDCDDLQYLRAKNWSEGNIPNWRAMSNNSVVCNDISLLPDAFWKTYEGGSEPYGLINIALSRKVGRIGETQYPDPDVSAYNPCAEQSLASYETCCLAEVYLPNIDNYQELVNVIKYLYRINKHSLRLPCHHKATEDIVHKNMRMGIGMTGILEASGEQRSWLSKAYEELRQYDKEYSAKKGWPTSIKLTTVKPSGTLSLLAGVTSGIHPGYSRYYIRRIRIASDSPLIDVCRKSGYHVEPQRNFDGTDDHNTMVVSFPCKHGESTILAKDVTAIDQLEYVKGMQKDWSDNAVSCTVYYRKEELPAIKKWLEDNYNEGVKSCSFLLHSEHGFDQAPLEEITEEKYNQMISGTSPITSVEIKESDFELQGCESGHCPVK